MDAETPPAALSNYVLDLATAERLHTGYHSVRGVATQVASHELPDLCVAAAVSALGAEKLAKLLDSDRHGERVRRELADARLASQRIVDARASLLGAASSCVGTHTAKVPDNRLKDGAILANAAVVNVGLDTLQGVASGTFVAQHPLSGANAGWSRAMRFLGWPVSIDGGAVTTIASILAGPPGSHRDGFLALIDEDAETVLLDAGAAFLRRQANGVPQRVEAEQKTVLWPVDDGYVAISPLAGFGLMSELERRLGERRRRDPERPQTQEVFQTVSISVGGTKPQNTALVASDIGGAFSRLLSLPQLPRRQDARLLLGQLARSAIHLQSRDVRKSSIDYLTSVLGDSRDNIARERARRAAIDGLVEDLLAPITALAAALRGVPAETVSIHPDNRLIAALAGHPGIEVDPDALDALADKAARAIAGRIDGLEYGRGNNRRTLHAAADGELRTLREHCLQALQELV